MSTTEDYSRQMSKIQSRKESNHTEKGTHREVIGDSIYFGEHDTTLQEDIDILQQILVNDLGEVVVKKL